MGTEDTCSSLFSQNPHLGKSKAGKFALSMGLVNLPAGFFGAVPMRHGTGGLAAHYRFGARSGGAPVMTGHFLKQKSDLDLAPIDPTPPPHQRIQALLSDPEFKRFLVNRFAVDPAFVRRKFYECAEACGFAKRIGGPEMIRRARAVELIHGNIPLPAVQRLLGLSSQNLRTADISYTEEELQRVTQFYVERESLRKTSARNTILGKITHILRGDIQAQLLLQYVLFFLEHKKQHRAHEKSGLTCSV